MSTITRPPLLDETFREVMGATNTLLAGIGSSGEGLRPTSWPDIQMAVRLGLGPKLFPVGYEFTVHDSVTDQDIIWVVRAHDHFEMADPTLTHSMTLETKYVWPTNGGVYGSMTYDAAEALYYAADGLAAGTYHFALLAGYETSYGGGTSYQFTLTQAVPAGGVLMFPWAYQSQAANTKIASYASRDSTTAIESVSVTEGTGGTDLGTADGNTEGVNHTHRIRYGSNHYGQSNIRQWLISDKAAGTYWEPQTMFDRPASYLASTPGLMYGLPADFVAAVMPTAVPCRCNSAYEVNSSDGTAYAIDTTYTLEDKFFLLSRPEIYGSWDSTALKDGNILDYYQGLSNAERRKLDAAGTACVRWLRSPIPWTAHYARLVNPYGALSSNNASGSGGRVPACNIA